MTNPSGGGFEYTDDSVVARLSFDVPAQALTDVSQLTQALSAMATQQEALARSTGSWLDYMNQVPQIMERASQTYREAITQMERMSYIQNEMGGGGGNVGTAASAGPQGGYSTAAPAGYVNPFASQMFGMGMTPDLTTAQQHMAGMATQDPRLYANMMAARGQAVNPALMGMMGGAVAGATGQGGQGGSGGGMGWGAAAPGSMSSQPTQSQRDSAAPPDPTQGGASKKAEPQNVPADPPEDAPTWQKQAAGAINGAQNLVNEARNTGGGRSHALGMASLGLAGAAKMMSRGGGGDGEEGGGGGFGRLAKGAAGVGAGIWAFNKAQDIGEGIQKYTQLGSVQGGDAGTGMGYEAQARLLALNPFITTQQARQAMQMALSEGFKGGDFDTVQDYMLSNFKDMGVQFSTSMALAKAGIYSGSSAGDATTASSDLLKSMFQLSREGGASFTERQQQATDVSQQLAGLGLSQEDINRGILGTQEGYADNKLLRDTSTDRMAQGMQNPLLLAGVGQRNHVTGYLPEAMAPALQAAGMDTDEIMNDAYKFFAQQAQRSSPGNKLNAVAMFMRLMSQQGVTMTYEEATQRYDAVLGGDDPVKKANERVANADKNDKKPFMSQVGEYLGTFTKPFAGAVDAIGDAMSNDWPDAWKALTDPYKDDSTNTFAGPASEGPGQKNKDQFAAAGRAPAPPPTSAQQAGPTVRTQGEVSGRVTITVDQSGRVTAPATIDLTGQQKSANTGYGSAQLNNPPPGDPSYGHAFRGMS